MVKVHQVAIGRWRVPDLGVTGLVRAWFERERARHELRRLDDEILYDIGVTRFDIQREIDKPFWRP